MNREGDAESEGFTFISRSPLSRCKKKKRTTFEIRFFFLLWVRVNGNGTDNGFQIGKGSNKYSEFCTFAYLVLGTLFNVHMLV